MFVKNENVMIVYFTKMKKKNDCFISPKLKKNPLKIGLKSSVISKVDHQMSKNWKKCVKPRVCYWWSPIT